MADMSDYLSVITADYTTTELTIAPQKTMEELGQKKQYFHDFDDGTLEVVTASASYFDVTIQWTWLSYTDAATLFDFYHDPNKANGRKRTFYWQHPLDGNTYVARFMSDLTQIDSIERYKGKEIPPLKMRIVGVKTA